MFVNGLLLVSITCFVALIAMYRPRSLESRAERAYEQWRGKRLAEGANFDDIRLEEHVREHLAKLRRVVSAAATPHHPEHWKDVMEQETAASSYVLRVLNPAYSKAFLDIVKTLKPEDVLYPDALERIRPKVLDPVEPVPAWRRERIAQDRLAAFTDLRR